MYCRGTKFPLAKNLLTILKKGGHPSREKGIKKGSELFRSDQGD